MSNAYGFSEDEDADIFDTPTALVSTEDHKAQQETQVNGHVIDGSICPACNHSHSMHSYPKELRHKIHEYLNNPSLSSQQKAALIAFIDKTEMTAAGTLYSFHNFTRNLDPAGENTVAITALFDVIDHITDGEATRILNFYDTQRRIIAAHAYLRSATTLQLSLQKAIESDVTEHEEFLQPIILELFPELHQTCEFIVDYITDRIEVLVQKYKEFAELANREVDQQVIESGIPSENNNNPALNRLIGEMLF